MITRATTWARQNMFRSPLDAIVTVVFGALSLYVFFRLARFVLVTGRWDIVDVNLKLLMVGRFPADELWRVSVALALLALWIGIIAGLIHDRQVRAGHSTAGSLRSARRWRDLARRFGLLIGASALLLALTSSLGPVATAAGVGVAGIVGRVVGATIGRALRSLPGMVLLVGVVVLAAGPIAVTVWLANAVGWDGWGGFMLNMFIALTSIVVCFPFGVLLALGRRSKLPLVRLLSTAYIEVFRGSPLFVLLLMANVALEFFIPRSMAPGTVVRAIVVFTLFTAAYVAEIVRGGLQSVHPGQSEAATALGLSSARTTLFIILPQALRNVIPAQIGQFISLFKDTTLAGAAMGLFELLNVGEGITKQTGFQGQGLIIESLAFVAFLFWVGSYTMSRESQRLEKKLGVGSR